ncbi:transmembrane 9 superfamily member 5 [Citrus sinensis]|nr:transmembrane 9 superfamily member 5 [Citrus sinensis]
MVCGGAKIDQTVVVVLVGLSSSEGGAVSSRSATSSPHDHRYNAGDLVPLLVNKVGPLNNPSETYQYYDLPFCRPEPIKWKKETLGEVLNGDRLASALYELKFLEAKTGVTLCSKKLKVDEVAKFRKAVADDFYFQMYYDDLPIWGYIGKIEDGSLVLSEKGNKYYLFTNVQFDALYNGDQVVEIRAFSDPTSAVDITDDIEINVKFTYSIVWSETSAQFETRMDKYSRASSLPTLHKIHWFSFINSIVFILLLMGLLILLILRRLKNDLRKCSSGDEEEDKEVGWKYIHGDVFRYPQNISLFSAVMGVVVAGYITSSFHNQFSDAGWERSVFLAGILYLGPLTVTVLILNTVAVSYGATAALPFGTIMVIVFIYMLFAVPLLALGGRIGYWFRSEFQAPSALNRYPREILPLPWYQKSPCQMFIVGLLSFSIIALELHHLYASLWGYKIFTLPGILFVMFIILLVLTAILSIGLTYIQLSVEDHEWWWRSNMSGFLQLSFFLGYNVAMCYAFFLILGSVSFRASMIFVRRIYRVVKSE